jgi:dihydroorotase
MMTLYLNPNLTPDEIRKAAKAGIAGVKSYPRGVTTNSEGGIESYTVYYPVFQAMEEEGMVLNIHGEVPSDPDSNVCVLNAEELFLKHLVQLHKDFPRLKIVLEHATTKAAVDTVKSLGDTVGCTITVHHLHLLVDDWAGCCHNFCKPVAKFPKDREALREIVKSGHPRFFLGTDSAPHPRVAKETAVAAAGVYVTPYVAPYLAHILESFGALDRLENFACRYGRRFYGLQEPQSNEVLTFERKIMTVPKSIKYIDDDGKESEVVPFMAGQALNFSLK